MVRIDSTDFVVADLPGLIEGAHDGAGLGDRFLGHAERCSVILHLIDGTQSELVRAYRTIRGELEAYGRGLSAKPEIVALNKMDAIDKAAISRKRSALEKASGRHVHLMSGFTGAGVTEVLHTLTRLITKRRRLERKALARKDSFATPMGRPSQNYQVCFDAILNRKQLVFDYDGKPREASPHVLGPANSEHMLLTYQFGGDSAGGLRPGGDWRCFSVDKMSDVRVRDGTWHTRPEHTRRHTCVDEPPDIDVNPKAPQRFSWAEYWRNARARDGK